MSKRAQLKPFQELMAAAKLTEVAGAVSRARHAVITFFLEVRLTRDAVGDLHFQAEQTAIMDILQMPDTSNDSRMTMLVTLLGALEKAAERTRAELAELTESAPPTKDRN